MKTHYEILGLLPQADDVVVRAAYKALAQKFHPDKLKNQTEAATELMARINAAYDVLGQKERRKKYDQQLEQRALRKAKAEKTKADKPKEEKAKAESPKADKPKQSPRHHAHQDLIDQLRHNAIDEISTVKLFEDTFKCSVTINNGWVNTYTVKGKTDRQVLDFARLKAKLLNHFSEEEA